MRLTSFTDFGFRALMRIASQPERAFSTAEIADEFGISRHHLTKTMAALANAGFLTTRRGAGGGAMLARPPEQIGLGHVMRVLEQDQPVVECFRGDGGTCAITAECRLKSYLNEAEAAFLARLDAYTLADCALAPRARPLADALP
ncbi:RrF2 family transcriptional regulator [Brevirhabdus sp.]|uniref:RrF2 family transcriptional regulator n=1 Tax=Brevirhabdus sp. TaxID=2004514 RepID=UPI004058C3C2